MLVESVNDYAIFALDMTGHVVSWNPGAQRFKGYTASEIIGRHFSTFYPPEDIAARKPDIELQIAASVGRLEDEGWRIRKDGTQFWANVVITALRTPDGQLVGFAKVTRDLTQRRAAELQALDDADDSQRKKRCVTKPRRDRETFRRCSNACASRPTSSSNAGKKPTSRTARKASSWRRCRTSSALRSTPLRGTCSCCCSASAGPLSDDQIADLTRVRRSQQHLLSLVNDILNFSRLEAGHVTYDIEPVALATAMESVAAMIGPQAATKQITFAWERCPPSIVALADLSKVEQILLNLLSNAVKFTPPGGRVSLRCDAREAHVFAYVQDTGAGIPIDRQTDIFEPFVQLDRSLVNSSEGVGLGLAISRDLARGMNGDLTVVSDVGAGSVFTLSLNRADSSASRFRRGHVNVRWRTRLIRGANVSRNGAREHASVLCRRVGGASASLPAGLAADRHGFPGHVARARRAPAGRRTGRGNDAVLLRARATARRSRSDPE